MSDAWHAVKVREFEHVLVSPSVALLRVTGKAPRRRAADGRRPTLLADDGHTVQRVAAIPSPPDARGTVRAAYSVDAALIDSGNVFSLELQDGAVIALPMPSRGATRVAAKRIGAPSGNAVAAAADRRADEDRRTGMVSKLSELSAALAESERVRGRLRGALASARAESEQADGRTRELEARVAELEAAPRSVDAPASGTGPSEQDVQERVRAALTQAESRAQAILLSEQEQAQARVAALEAEHAAARQSHEAVASEAATRHEQQLTELEESHRTRLSEVEQAHETAMSQVRDGHDTELDQVKRSRDELERSLAAYIAEADARQELQSSFEDERASAAQLRDELERTQETVQRLSGERDDLDTWRGELERRLTETTDELTRLRQGRQDEAAQLLWLRGELAEAEAKVELAEARGRGDGDGDSEKLAQLTAENEALRTQLAERGNGSLGDPARSGVTSMVRYVSPARVHPDDVLGADDQADAATRRELDELRDQLAQARETASRQRHEMLARTAIADAQQQAERELSQAAPPAA